jgi:CRP-like cAMP-binding protein
MSTAPAELRRNGLLALLDEATLAKLAPSMELMPFELHQPLYEEQEPMRFAWFPVEGVLSMLAPVGPPQESIEVATIGREGMLGLSLFLGAQRSPSLVFVQVEGAGYRLPADTFLAAASDGSLQRVMQRYAQALLVQISQGTACNRAHSADRRCARWLLQTHDRVAKDEFELKQEFLGQMLGERRATVSNIASQMQAEGLIRYSRGRISVVDRAGLEQAACACYGIVREEYERMLGKPAH